MAPTDRRLLMLGIDHRRAGVATRERLAFTADSLPTALTALKAVAGVEECVVLSTCNRTELYAVIGVDAHAEDAAQSLVRFLSDHRGVPMDVVAASTYCLDDLDVVRHLFRVSSGLDSMIVGEVEILGQVREALKAAQRACTIGKWLSTLFRHALQVGKRARSETGISHNAASVSYAAVELARNLIGDIRSSQVLLVGAGRTAELVARTLVSNGVEGLAIVNRTLDHATRLADTLGGSAHRFDSLLPLLVAADIVISSTDAPHAVLTAETVRQVLQARRGRRLLLIDLAVPRDVEPAIGTLPDVHLYDLDDLERYVERNLERRAEETYKVDAMIVEEIDRFVAWQSSHRVVSTIAGLQRRAEQVRQAELDKVSLRLSRLSPEERQAVEAATRGIVSKMLHHPITLLKEVARTGDDAAYVATVRALFDLELAQQAAEAPEGAQ